MVLFVSHVDEMRDMISLKTVVKFAISLSMDEKIAQGSYVLMCKNTMAGHIPCLIQYKKKGTLNENIDLLHLNQNNN